MRRSHDRFAAADRGHLDIENSLRWCLDVAFREDHSRVHDLLRRRRPGMVETLRDQAS